MYTKFQRLLQTAEDRFSDCQNSDNGNCIIDYCSFWARCGGQMLSFGVPAMQSDREWVCINNLARTGKVGKLCFGNSPRHNFVRRESGDEVLDRF